MEQFRSNPLPGIPAYRAGGNNSGLTPGDAAEALRQSFGSDQLCPGRVAVPDLAGLAAVQSSIMRNYFRLLRAQEDLEQRAGTSRGRATAGVLEQMEIERARLAHELHAGAGQALAGIKIHLELIDAALPEPPAAVRASLHRIGLLAQEALRQVRSIAHRTHPAEWESGTLAGALQRLWDMMGVPQKFDACLRIAPLAEEPPHHVRILLYRVAQEALANGVRHARATRIGLFLGPGGGQALELRVEDNGQGFDANGVLAGAAPSSGGIGLRSMHQQLRWAGGQLRIDSGAHGTRLTAWVPCSET